MYKHCYAFIICHLPRCNLFTQEVIYLSCRRHQSSELWTLVHSFTIVYNLLQTVFLLLTTNHHLPHHTFNPLCSARLVGLTTSLYHWGKVFYCVVQVPRCSDTGSAPYQCQLHQPRVDLISPTSSITLVSY